MPADELAPNGAGVGQNHNKILDRFFESRAKNWVYSEDAFRSGVAAAINQVVDVDPETINFFLDMSIDDNGELVIWDRDYTGFTQIEESWTKGLFDYTKDAITPEDVFRLTLDYKVINGEPTTENLEYFFSTMVSSSNFWADHCDCEGDKDGYGAMVIGMDGWGAIKGGLIGGWVGAIVGGSIQSIVFEIVEPDDG